MNKNEKKKATLEKRFKEMKKAHEDQGEPEAEPDNLAQGVIPERSFKKNLGCG